MGKPHLEDAIGIVDSVNTLFQTSIAYQSGTLSVFINGQLKRGQDDDGWTELGGTGFQLKEAPLGTPPTGGPEKVRVFYTDTSIADTEVVEGIVGIIDEVDGIIATLISVEDVVGILEEVDGIAGVLDDIELLDGSLEEIEILNGTICECGS